MARIPIKPDLLKWARGRVGMSVADLSKRFPKYEHWEQEEIYPTMKQLESLSAITRTPLGYFFLESPPEDVLPIPDLRTIGDERIDRPSPDLLETVERMQLRQAWMTEFLIEEGAAPLPFVSRTPIKKNPVEAATDMRNILGLADGWLIAYAMENNCILVTHEVYDANVRKKVSSQ